MAKQLADVKSMFEQGLIPSQEIYENKVRQILAGPLVNELPARFRTVATMVVSGMRSVCCCHGRAISEGAALCTTVHLCVCGAGEWRARGVGEWRARTCRAASVAVTGERSPKEPPCVPGCCAWVRASRF